MCKAVTSKVGRQIPPPVFTSGIYRYLPVWKILLKWQIPANTGKLNFFALKYSRNLKQDGLKQYNGTKGVKDVKLIYMLKIITPMNKVFLNINNVESELLEKE